MKTKNKKYNFTVHAFEKVMSFQTEKKNQPTHYLVKRWLFCDCYCLQLNPTLRICSMNCALREVEDEICIHQRIIVSENTEHFVTYSKTWPCSINLFQLAFKWRRLRNSLHPMSDAELMMCCWRRTTQYYIFSNYYSRHLLGICYRLTHTLYEYIYLTHMSYLFQYVLSTVTLLGGNSF